MPVYLSASVLPIRMHKRCNGKKSVRAAFRSAILALARLSTRGTLAAMNRKQQGFSLIEIMVVLVIIATLSGSGLYAWQRWQTQQRLWQTTQQLRQFLTLLRNDANSFNREHRLQLRRSGERGCLTSAQAGTLDCSATSAWQFMPAWPDVHIVDMTDGLAFFGLRGTAWPGNIRLCNAAGEWQIIVSVWGRIRLTEVAGGGTCG